MPFWYDVGSLEKYEKLDDDCVKGALAFLLPAYCLKSMGASKEDRIGIFYKRDASN